MGAALHTDDDDDVDRWTTGGGVRGSRPPPPVPLRARGGCAADRDVRAVRVGKWYAWLV